MCMHVISEAFYTRDVRYSIRVRASSCSKVPYFYLSIRTYYSNIICGLLQMKMIGACRFGLHLMLMGFGVTALPSLPFSKFQSLQTYGQVKGDTQALNLS